MKKRQGWFMLGGCAAAALVLGTAGCATKGTISPPTTADTMSDIAPESATCLLNVSVVSTAVNADAQSVAPDVKRAVEGELAARHFAMNKTNPDVEVTLAVEVTLFDQSGNYYRYNAKADAKVQRAAEADAKKQHDKELRNQEQKLLGQRVFNVSGERKLDKGPALTALGAKLASDMAAWVADTCTPVQSELAANDITVRRGFPHKASGDPEYATRFVNQVGGLKEVVSCRLVSQDYARRTMVFRVVYYKDMLPEGLLNRLAGLPDLGIRPAQ